MQKASTSDDINLFYTFASIFYFVLAHFIALFHNYFSYIKKKSSSINKLSFGSFFSIMFSLLGNVEQRHSKALLNGINIQAAAEAVISLSRMKCMLFSTGLRFLYLSLECMLSLCTQVMCYCHASLCVPPLSLIEWKKWNVTLSNLSQYKAVQ